jgi:hypothetical protein
MGDMQPAELDVNAMMALGQKLVGLNAFSICPSLPHAKMPNIFSRRIVNVS